MTILDFLFPRKCLGCGREGAYFCSQCLNYFSLDNKRICPVCEKPAIGGKTHFGCLLKYDLDGLTSIFDYKSLISKSITKLKYRFVTDLASELVEVFVSSCGEDPEIRNLCLKKVSLVPIPLHKNRERWRGFSQTKLLGKMIAENLAVEFIPDLLVRTKDTKPQVGLGEFERTENIKNAFSVFTNPKFLIPNSQIILFDDVWTSGATMKEAAKTLKKAGAKFVWGLTIAR